jgi:integrase
MSFLRKRNKVYHLYWKDEAGGQDSRSLHTGNKTLALEIKKQFDEGRVRDMFGLATPVPIGKLITSRLDSLAKPGTRKREQSVYNAFKDFLGNTDTAAINPALFERYKTHRLSLGLSPNSLNTELRHLHRLFTWGEENGLCRSVKIRKVKPQKHKPLAVTLAEINRVFEYIAIVPLALRPQENIQDVTLWRLYWKTLLRLYLLTGGRKCEVGLLHWQDIDFDQAAVMFTDTKTDEDRPMPIKADLLEELKTLRQMTQAKDDDLIAMHNPNQIFVRIKGFMLAAGIPLSKKPGLHVLRRTFGSYHYRLGKDLLATKEALGHSESRTTEAHYIDTLEQVREQVEKLPF